MFKCKHCGECCRHLGEVEIYKDLDRGDGVCRYLRGDDCSIYNVRPLICRIDEAYEGYFKEMYTKEEYYNLNYNACGEFIERRKRRDGGKKG